VAIRGTDFVLNPSKLEKEYMLVEVSECTDLAFHMSGKQT